MAVSKNYIAHSKQTYLVLINTYEYKNPSVAMLRVFNSSNSNICPHLYLLRCCSMI